MRFLVVEDELDIRRPLVASLREAGFAVDEAESATEAHELAVNFPFDALMVDVGLPEGPQAGFSLVRQLRSEGHAVPVLFLTARDAVEDRITGLDAGGDDYLPKPYAFAELLARVEVLGRRKSAREAETLYRVGDLELDRLSHEVRRAGRTINLQPREFRLLEHLMRHAGQVVTRTMLLEKVWDYHFDPQTNVVDVGVGRLRRKLEDAGNGPVLATIWGSGYRLQDG